MVLLTQVTRNVLKNTGFRKWYYNLSGYNKFGLYQNDLVALGQYPENPETEPVYKEALRRLPSDEYDRYVFRIIRCAQLEITKSFVPPQEMPTFEEDETKGRFLEPYIKEILAEKKEKEEWQDFLSQK